MFLCFLPIVRSNLVPGSLVLGWIIAAFACFNYNDSKADRREVADYSYLLGFLRILAMIIATLQDMREADMRAISGLLIHAIGIAMTNGMIGMVMRIFILEPISILPTNWARNSGKPYTGCRTWPAAWTNPRRLRTPTEATPRG